VKYVALIYGDENRWASLSESERKAVYKQYRAFSDAGGAKIVDGAETADTKSATTVRVRDGQTQVTDGPHEQVPEPLGGFYVLECDTMDEAVALAQRIPGAETGVVEVRPEYVEASA
jgi:hypothetical protein